MKMPKNESCSHKISSSAQQKEYNSMLAKMQRTFIIWHQMSRQKHKIEI